MGGFTLPPTPFPGLWFEAVAGCNRIFFRCSFRAPFFSPLGTPQNRYHKLFRLQSGSVLGFKPRSKKDSHFGTGFFFSFCRFCDFLHTTSSASRIAPAVSRPHFRLSSFLLFLLSLRPSFLRVFGYKMGTKTNPKTEPETGPLKKLRSSERKIPYSKKVTKMVPQKGGPCETLASSMLCCCFLLEFWAFRAYFGR